MSSIRRFGEQRFNIEIGRELFHVFCANCHTRLLHRIEENWSDYLTHSDEEGCKVTIFPYTRKQRFPWKVSDLKKLKEFFLLVQRRFPENGQAEQLSERSLRILQYFDPRQEQIKEITSWVDCPETIAYSIVGFDLYFFNPKTNAALFFVKKRLRSSHTFIGVTNGIMFVLSHRLTHKGGLLVHGAAVQKNGQGVLFLGLSGAGKSTVARLCDPDVCFSDDGVVIKKEGDRIYAYQSPFGQFKRDKENTGPVKGEIKKMFLLEKSCQDKVVLTRKEELMSIMLMQLIHFYKYLNRETARAGFYVTKDIVEGVPAYKLQFTKGKTIWNDIF